MKMKRPIFTLALTLACLLGFGFVCSPRAQAPTSLPDSAAATDQAESMALLAAKMTFTKAESAVIAGDSKLANDLYKEAYTDVQGLIARYPYSSNAYLLRGKILEATKISHGRPDFEKARDLATQQISQKRTSERYVNRAKASEELNDCPSATADLQAAINLDPSNWMVPMWKTEIEICSKVHKPDSVAR